ncbi:MAG: hypothetical protein M1818_007565 [Claussenomyces sp. TS43310]|nr:MAG: hypothetical protein M1818_007565 [Claussenomyces sp. TS43310]
MRFFVLAAALFVSAAVAEPTTYVTVEFTKTQCAATVTNCPARSTVTSTTSYPATTSSSAVTVYSTTPVGTTTASIKPVWSANSTIPAGPTGPTVPVSVPTPASSSVVVPAVVTVTVNYCPAPVSSAPTLPGTLISTTTAPVVASTGTGIPAPSSNGTVAVPSAPSSTAVPTTPPFTGAASSLGGSMLLAGAAGVAAVLFA